MNTVTTKGKGKTTKQTAGGKVTKVHAHAKKTAGQKKAAEKGVALHAAAATAGANAEKTAQPGIISTIMNILLDATKHGKPVTTDEILAKLQAQFPERPAAGMMVTVRAQLSRLPKEKDFAIDKQRDGRVVRYQAVA